MKAKVELARAFIGIDVHARNSVLGVMDEEGNFLGEQRVKTSVENLLKLIEKVAAKEKIVTFEEGPMAQWLYQYLRPACSRLLVCNPCENALIARSAKKRDEFDVRQLCRLLRLGELKEVYHTDCEDRAFFKMTVQQYMHLRDNVVALKNRIKCRYRRFGVFELFGTAVYSPAMRGKQLARIAAVPQRRQIAALCEVLDCLVNQWKLCLKEVTTLGRAYPEIAEFLKIPGVGPVGAHVFDAYIQTPHRFETVQQVWRYCKLGIRDRSSDGKPLGYQKLDWEGNGELKMMSYHAWKGAVVSKKGNEVKAFYQASLGRTSDCRHARLNTQRKIIKVMWTIWKKGEAYRPEAFPG